jgi:hypothetical protein
MQKQYANTEKVEHTRSDSMYDDCGDVSEDINRDINRDGIEKSVYLYTKVKIRSLVSSCFVIGAFILLFLIPLSRGEAQTDIWTPAWVDLSDSGVIHIIGLDVDASTKFEPPVSDPIPADEKPGMLETVKQFFSSFTRSYVPYQNHITGWTTIFSDHIEGAFPGDWNVFDNDGSNNGEYFWAKKDCRPYTGSYSAWVVGAGADGSALSCSSAYPDNAQSWMVYGPFSLEEATDAEFIFMYWLNSEPIYDDLFVGASIDGNSFYGETNSGDQDWTEKNFDLTDVYTLGDLTGQPEVWVAIAFQSDSSVSYSEGAYVDNIEIRQYVDGEPTVTPPPQNNICYLPFVKSSPPIPVAPVLNAISNGDGDGNYTVSWSTSAGATTYSLQEDDNTGFSSPITVYAGAGLSKAISGRDVGTYYYRVRASNTTGDSDWSNVESVEVTVPLPDCPQAGAWSGSTSQGGDIYFQVEDSPQCQITYISVDAQYCFPPYNYFVPVFWEGWEFPIIDSSFTTGPSFNQVTGSFTSLTTANGDFSIRFTRTDPYYQTCQSTGTWTANP